MLAWLRQLETPRKLLNMLPALHRQLYYRDYLKLQPQPPVADSVILSMALDDGLVETTVKANTLFDGGTDTLGNPLHYALEHDLVVNTGQLTDLIEVNPETKLKRTLIALPDCNLPLGGQWLFTDLSGDKNSLEGEQPIINSVVASGQAALPVAEKIRNVRYFSHPHLLLSSGTRVISLSIAGLSKEIASTIKVEHYQQGKWVSLKNTSTAENTVEITLTPGDKPLLAPPNVAKDLSLPATEFPLLKLSNTDGTPVGKITSIRVAVTGAAVLFSTDAGDSRPNKPSLPFGNRGKAGSGFNIMSPDWVNAAEKFTVTINPTWIGLPSSGFIENYKNYPKLADGSVDINDDSKFTVSSYLCKTEQQIAPTDQNVKLFKANAGSALPQGSESGLKFEVTARDFPYATVDSKDPRDWPWWLRVSLNSTDFKADEYDKRPFKTFNVDVKPDPSKPSVEIPNFEIKSQVLDKNDPNVVVTPAKLEGVDSTKIPISHLTIDKIDPKDLYSAPYLPQWSSVAVDFNFAAMDVTGSQWTQDGLGYMSEPNPTPAMTLFDSTSTSHTSDSSPDAGSLCQLYLGFSQLLPLAKISLYWQLRTPLSHQLLWQYLVANNQWRSLDATVEDNTLSLSRSGLWSCVLPADAATQSTLLPTGKHWLRAVFTANADDKKEGNQPGNYPLLYSVTANAGKATLINAATVDDAHFATPLLADSVKAPVEDLPDIAKITQRAPSFAGKTAENDDQFNDRVAQRLRHRNRALSWKDISTLLTAKYPEIQALKMGETDRSEKILVVMPYVSHSDNNDRLRPTINQGRLAEMASYIKSLGTPWLSLKVVNPTYKEVLISYEVSFVKGVIPAYGDQLLRRAIQQRFMPWATHDSSRQLPLGNRINYYDMLALLENQDYVDKVESLVLGDLATEPQQVLVIKPRSDPKLVCVLEGSNDLVFLNILVDLSTSDIEYKLIANDGIHTEWQERPYAKTRLEDKQGELIDEKLYLGTDSTINETRFLSLDTCALLKIFHPEASRVKDSSGKSLYPESRPLLCYEFSDFKVGEERTMSFARRASWELQNKKNNVLVNMYFNYINGSLDVCIANKIIPSETDEDYISIIVKRNASPPFSYHFGKYATVQSFESLSLKVGDVITIMCKVDDSILNYKQFDQSSVLVLKNLFTSFTVKEGVGRYILSNPM
ncbi:putative mucin/carbohydrate-binding domain-containing protein [Rouxiella sp. WC2420]|uniref:Mucin/carbohydrate-binding domain-containing protein n=1 Tax=Rouxiella sp. WC2420 TaxID=3234145 RepID=A0AB39VVW0_9GAMM